MLQTRPTSATGRMPSGQQQSIPQFGHSTQAPRAAYHGNATFTGYRGSSTPVQQYAFQSTPSLNTPYRGPSPPTAPGSTNRAAPDRYRRGQPQPGNHSRSQSATLPSTTTLPNTVNFYNIGNNSRSNRPASFYGALPGTSMDDMHIHQQSQAEAKALRRRSMHTQDPATTLKLQPEPAARGVDTDPKALRAVSGNSAHSRSGSSGSVNSSRSNHSRPSVSHGACFH